MSELGVLFNDARIHIKRQHESFLRESQFHEEYRQRVYARWDRKEREERERQQSLETDTRLQRKLSALIERLSPAETKCAAKAPAWAVKSVDSAGVFTAYGSTWHGPDCVGDYVLPGAFRHKCGGSVPLLWMHRGDEPIGRCRDLQEDSIGLKFRGCLELDSPKGRESYSWLKHEGLDSFSIGFRILQARDRKGGGRDLVKLDLVEISLVTVPCNGHSRLV